MSESLNIILNGKIVKGIPGETILQLAKRNGLDIPTLCNDPRIDPFSSCYVCVVEVEGIKGLQPSCSTTVTDGMKIDTDNARVRSARKTALELLVSNHYADCMGPCKQTCPAGVDVQGYISYIEKGMYHEAVALIKETNPLPAVCGRVCVRPCEVACRRNLLDEGAPVGIDYLKRFASDIDLMSPEKWRPAIKESTGKKVAVIGAGPAGLSCGFFLQKEGHQVDIFEAGPKPGGWLRYGIPEYRLPNDILQREVDNITEMGVNIYYNRRLGENIHYNDLKQKYDATILCVGSQKGTLIGCEGDDAGNVFSGIEFLKNMELTGERFDFKGKKVAVIGGGNTAMDCCRSARRCGSEEVYIIYRRTEKEMPANPIEIHESKLEGVKYLLLTNPTRVNKDESGNVRSVTCIRMQLGEPDASGRRRPVPVEGSETEIEVDYILAAIGQKTHVDFLDNINSHVENGQLKLNRWGDIDTDPATLRTGIENIFAAGDGVTGPATLIQAIGQAKIASRSCHQFMMGFPVKPPKPEFLSKRDNFKVQVDTDYIGNYEKQLREEMPTLNPADRMNFREVELGYAGEKTAFHETQRCLECGCSEYYTCDLKRYCTDYEAEQLKFKGEFKEYEVDFRHPYIEIDSNKCILCSRCIRICREVVGADALGLINRGFDTYVAPSMGERLQDTFCESCGMCISTCPTGAITENFAFKPGPVKTESVDSICHFCSVGCAITLNHKNGFVFRTTGSQGLVNTDGNLCRFPKFGYRLINDPERITKPMIREGDRFREIGFGEAFRIIHEKVIGVNPDENIFFAGGRLSNEELYMIQKLARAGVKTNNVASFHYLGRGTGYLNDTSGNVPFEQIAGASRIYLIGSEINRDHAVAGFMVHNTGYRNHVPVELVTIHPESTMLHKADRTFLIKSYYHFIKAVNYYLVDNKFSNNLFIKDRCQGFETYRERLLNENFVELVKLSGVEYMDVIIEFAKQFNSELNAIIIFSENEVCGATAVELQNLALITGKLGKSSNGLIVLKEKNNSQGLHDMGICPSLGIGSVPIHDPDLMSRMKEKWHLNQLPKLINANILESLNDGSFTNVIIFGEDPVGCATNPDLVSGWLEGTDLLVVQDYFMTETARRAHIVLPASWPFETGGSFTNTQRIIQEFEPVLPAKTGLNTLEQITGLMSEFGIRSSGNSKDILAEIFSLLPEPRATAYEFRPTDGPAHKKFFLYGCDSVVAKFENQFNLLLNN